MLVPDPKIAIFQKFMEWAWCKTPARLRAFMEEALYGLSPNVPDGVSKAFDSRTSRRAFIASGSLTFILCFVVMFVWSAIEGTLYGEDPGRLYFIKDTGNIINYSIICPMYVSFAVSLIVMFIYRWPKIRDMPKELFGRNSRVPSLAQPSLWAIVLFLSSIVTSRYISECLDPIIYEKVPWYVSSVSSSGQRIIGAIGVYYAILNFCLLVVCISATLCYFSMFASCISIGRLIAETCPDTDIEFDNLKTILESFTNSYILAKWFAAFVMLNSYTWKAENPNGSMNIVIMGIVLTFFGVFFVSIPRYYIQLEWFKYQVRRSVHLSTPIPSHIDDFRPLSTQLQAYILDILLFGGFIGAFWI